MGGWPEEYPRYAFADHDRGEEFATTIRNALLPAPTGAAYSKRIRGTAVEVAHVEGIDNIAIRPVSRAGRWSCGLWNRTFRNPRRPCSSDHCKDRTGGGLPAQLDGVWAKVSPAATQSYLISAFSEVNITQILESVKHAGFAYLYHDAPFRNWGHFELNPEYFPGGDESLQRCVAIADEMGDRLASTH